MHSPDRQPLAAHATQSASMACPEHARNAVTAQGVTSARGVKSLPALHRRPNNDKVHGMSTTTAQAICPYTKTSMEKAGKGSSPEQR
jgi:hypothetical protein